MTQSLRIVLDGQEYRRRSTFASTLAATAVVAALVVPILPFLPLHEAQSASAGAPADCPIPVHEGDTWIARRWIERGELRLECAFIAGVPRFGYPLPRNGGPLQ